MRDRSRRRAGAMLASTGRFERRDTTIESVTVCRGGSTDFAMTVKRI